MVSKYVGALEEQILHTLRWHQKADSIDMMWS